ncbi:MAG: zinc-binding dehydrogenase [Rhizobiales bacterium]|nr:zinc-binding dehydrogenase [Hyphomicrobiales bacterium]
MRAVILKAFGHPATLETTPNPVLGTGEVIVDVVACPVLSYAGEVLSGARKYLLDLPVIPGNGVIGRVAQTGPDATQLKTGDWVYCDPTVRSRDNALTPDITLQALSAGSEGGLKLQQYFRDGGWAEQIRVPTENAKALGDIDPDQANAWASIGSLLVPYGGLLAGKLQAGETIVINGATGKFGSAAIAVAFGMGAGCVIATGRNKAALSSLVEKFDQRLRVVAMQGNEATDQAAIKEAAPGPVDMVLDLLPPAASPAQVMAALMTVRPNGRVVLMGGVGTQDGATIDLPYAWLMRHNITIRGQWMYPPHAASMMVGLIRAGLISLDLFEVTAFDLKDFKAAIDHAAANSGPFRTTVVRPS